MRAGRDCVQLPRRGSHSASFIPGRADLFGHEFPQADQPSSDVQSRQWLEQFITNPLTAPSLDGARLELLVRCGLGAYAYVRGVPDHPVKRPLWQAFMLTTARHMKVRAELQRLFRGWSAAGIDVLLFKGFHLAEFVYDPPGQRFYRDVDVVMNPARAGEASLIAQSCGWLERWHISHPVTMLSPYDEAYSGHEVLHLAHPVLGITIDIHKRILHNLHDNLGWSGPQARITASVWQASRRITWGDAELRVPAPEDAILIGPMLNRCWSVWDNWVLEPHDYLDFRMVVEKLGVTRSDLEARARTLGCFRTLDLFLRRCDPWRRHFTLGEPTRAERQRWNFIVSFERGHVGIIRRFMAVKAWPGEMAATIRELPTAIRVAGLLRKGLPPEDVVRRLDRGVVTSSLLGYREWLELKRAAARTLSLLRVAPEALWPAYVLTLYAGLRQRGCPAEVRCEGELVLEADGHRLLPEP